MRVVRGVVKGFDGASYRATVQVAGSLSVWLEGVPVARNIASSLLTAGRRCVVVFFDETNPQDAAVVAVYD
ncbi:hypothetical protein HRbin24_01703 [bacterium HR24]|nr:hypothetical protein HRbin24_01703 [bacterium HR24]